MNYTLGIDQSYTNTGWCVLDTQKKLISFGLIKGDKSFDIYHKARQIAVELRELILCYKPDSIAMEGLGFAAFGSATRDLAGLQFTIINLNPDVSFSLVAPTSLKKQACGNGKADKAEMIAKLPVDVRAAFDAMGVKKTTGLSDLADAYWLACSCYPNR